MTQNFFFEHKETEGILLGYRHNCLLICPAGHMRECQSYLRIRDENLVLFKHSVIRLYVQRNRWMWPYLRSSEDYRTQFHQSTRLDHSRLVIMSRHSKLILNIRVITLKQRDLLYRGSALLSTNTRKIHRSEKWRNLHRKIHTIYYTKSENLRVPSEGNRHSNYVISTKYPSS
jgi:hypothetical protein